MSAAPAKDSVLPDFDSDVAVRRRRWRHVKDVTVRHLMAVGGISVILAIVLIAFYLLYVVLPLFRPAAVEGVASYDAPGGSGGSSVHYAIEEQREIGLRVTAAGAAIFFRLVDGAVLKESQVTAAGGGKVTAFSAGAPSQQLLAFGLENGAVNVARHQYDVTYPGDRRVITPRLHFPLGEAPVPIDPRGGPVRLVSAQSDGDRTTIAVLSPEGRISISSFSRKTSFLSDDVEIVRTDSSFTVPGDVSHLEMDIDQEELYVADARGTIYFFDISNKKEPRLVQEVNAVRGDARITSLAFLAGGISILVGDSQGRITQWFPVRDEENNYSLQRIRMFDSQEAPVTGLAPEYFRKGFLAIDQGGELGIYHTTAHRVLKVMQPGSGALTRIAVSPRADAALVEEQDGTTRFLHVANEHPEVSWDALWGRVWYESRAQPEFIWQSSSASSDFEPKFSLTPLAFGTLKGAFFAMLVAMPLGILSAIYTGYFMAPRMRNMVKPVIEIMAALPTVILGFLAGLWFAPFLERHMPGFFACLVVVPLSVLAAAWLWERLPQRIRLMTREGWEAALVTPVIIAAIGLSFMLSQPLENLFFGGNMPLWITNELGLDFNQRNSLVVGIAMGFAVIPIIFSISEDAIYGVPNHLTIGSLALGATPWQTMVRVVLLTASPGIFSAVMIGLGRAVGETMIVLMATGNTAVMDMNVFEGFRALSANIAVEMPESEVGGTHYRILFLAGLVLFVATFLVNTVAEIVRQRLRVKYSSL